MMLLFIHGFSFFFFFFPNKWRASLIFVAVYMLLLNNLIKMNPKIEYGIIFMWEKKWWKSPTEALYLSCIFSLDASCSSYNYVFA